MKISVLRKMEYEGRFIYILQFRHIFQYLIAWDKEIFQDHITLKPALLSRILYQLRLKPAYTKEQLEEGEKIILSGAMKTIDELLLKAGKKGSRPDRRKVKQIKEKNAKKKCVWQSREADGGKYWVCLTHGNVVKMKDGVKPSHK